MYYTGMKRYDDNSVIRCAQVGIQIVYQVVIYSGDVIDAECGLRIADAAKNIS